MTTKTIQNKFYNFTVSTLAITAILSGFYNITAFALPAPTNIVNNAGVGSTTFDDVLTNNSVSVTDKLCYRADLNVTLSAAANINVGQSLSYTTAINNIGPSTATAASFVFAYDNTKVADPTTFVATSGTLGSTTFAGSGASRTATIAITGLTLASTQSFNVTFSQLVLGSATGSITPTVSVNPTAPANNDSICSMQDPALTNNDLRPFTTTLTPVANLAITKTSDGTGGFFTGSNSTGNVVGRLRSKSNVTYTLTVTNNGPSTAQGPITVTDTYNTTQLTYTSGTASGWTCANAIVATTGTVTCTRAANMVNGATESIAIIMNVV